MTLKDRRRLLFLFFAFFSVFDGQSLLFRMNKLLDALPKDLRGKLKKKRQPSWSAPMLATLTDERFSDPGWLFERKFDGERVLVFCKGKRVRLLSRNRKLLNNTYPELVGAYRKRANGNFIVDGEVVAFHGRITSFSRLQGRMQLTDPDKARKSRIAIYQYLFDLLFLDGYDTTHLPLRHRKMLLHKALKFTGPLRFSAHRVKEGEKFYKEACNVGLEGLIAKNADSEYVHCRSRDWLKFKCVNEQEFVIGGYTDPQGTRIGFGALLVGYYDEQGKLHFAGKVGTGFDSKMLADLYQRLKAIEIDKNPFANGAGREARAHFVEPTLVAEIEYSEWTQNHML